MNPLEKIKTAQALVGALQDGLWRSKSQAALDRLAAAADLYRKVRTGLASSFADAADVKAFKKCKAEGKSDLFCFGKGDNGIGCWGDDTTADRPMCALPPEDWAALDNPRGALVEVTVKGKRVVCELRDRMPHWANIENGAVVDLNAAAWRALGHKPPALLPCSWRWA